MKICIFIDICDLSGGHLGFFYFMAAHRNIQLGTISKINKYVLKMKCAKFVAFTTKPTIVSQICPAINAFQFNHNKFLQIKGTAMGTRMAPSSACLTMGDIENKILSSTGPQPLLWLRYIDDNLVIWTHGPEQLDIFTETINTQLC